MKAFIIHISTNELSVESANKTRESAIKTAGLKDVTLYDGVHKNQTEYLLNKHKFKILDYESIWVQHQYFEPALGCFFSHYYLWEHCVELNERIMVLEHDAIFHREFVDYEFDGVLNIGEPNQWQINKQKFNFGNIHKQRTQEGIVKKDCDCEEKKYQYGGCHCINFFLQGAHSYIITPHASKKLIEKAKTKGILPADCHMNRENIEIADLFPHCVHANQTFSLIHRDIHDGRSTKIPKGRIAWND